MCHLSITSIVTFPVVSYTVTFLSLLSHFCHYCHITDRSHGACLTCLHVADNPVTVTGATEDALVDTTNSQFSFESKAFLDEVLAEQFLSDKTQLLMDYVQVVMQKLGVKTTKVAEFGCGPGLTSFLLTKTFKEVRSNIRYIRWECYAYHSQHTLLAQLLDYNTLCATWHVRNMHLK